MLLELELEFELEFELELLLEFELELELEFELWFELELLLELELWFELEFELWLELELELVFELWFELWFELDWARSRLIVRRLLTARARHHWIGLPSIFRSTTTLEACVGAFAVRAALSSIGAADTWSSCDRAESGSSAAPTARPSAPNAPA